MSRVGVFICHCGTNIASVVDVEKVAEAARSMPNVAFATTYKYMCSEPGQAMIKEAIIEHKLDRIVIGSCSPRMHELTFRKMLKGTDINPYMLEVANIREQCSWVHKDMEVGTEKAIILGRTAIAKVNLNAPLTAGETPVTKRALVIGGGIAGIQTALDTADAGFEVVDGGFHGVAGGAGAGLLHIDRDIVQRDSLVAHIAQGGGLLRREGGEELLPALGLARLG